MKIYSVFDQEFNMYGRVLNDSFNDILKVLKDTECPADKTIYSPSDKGLESTPSFAKISYDYYGNMPVQLGYCNGHNNTLNCLEYHLGSEINVSNDEFILILGLRQEIKNGVFDTSLCRAFRVPPKVAVEVYSTSLHYAPIGLDGKGFRVLIALPKGTNVSSESSLIDKTLFATNKWLYAHKDSPEAKNGAYIGLIGENIVL